jgi:hypothetical protein
MLYSYLPHLNTDCRVPRYVCSNAILLRKQSHSHASTFNNCNIRGRGLKAQIQESCRGHCRGFVAEYAPIFRAPLARGGGQGRWDERDSGSPVDAKCMASSTVVTRIDKPDFAAIRYDVYHIRPAAAAPPPRHW